MKVQFIGNVAGEDFEDVLIAKLDEVLVTTAEKLQEDKGANVESVIITEAEFTVGLKIEGIEEPQLLSVEHHEGQPEMFKWVVDLDNGKEENNEEESFVDEWTASMQQGKEKEFATIESVYDAGDLTLDEKETVGNMDKVTLNHKDGFKVVKVYQNDKLIQEYKLTPKA